jgi:hypothetical protein
MGPLLTTSIVFVCVFVSALLGLIIGPLLPSHHLSSDSKQVVNLGMGLISMMAAIALGLLVATADGSYDTKKNELTQMSANYISIDRALAHYGPESAPERALLRRALAEEIDRIWPNERTEAAMTAPGVSSFGDLYEKVQGLEPHNDSQRMMKDQALQIGIGLGQTRWLLFEQAGSSIPAPFLVILVFWLSVIFASFGLFAPRNATVILTLFVCALSVSGAVFLILELDHPFRGIIQIPSAPMRAALVQLGK